MPIRWRWPPESYTPRSPTLVSRPLSRLAISSSRWASFAACFTCSRLISALYVEDGSYIRFKNISLGYTLPPHWLQSLSVSACRIYLTAQNLFTITSYTGYDPEVNRFGSDTISQGIDYGAYPAAKTFLLGLNLKF